MAFIAIDTSELDVGDALKKELFDKIKGNLDDHEDRLTAFESLASKIPVFKFLVKNNSLSPTSTGLAYFTASENFTITSAFIQIFTKGSLTGTLEIDIQKSATLGGTFSSIFTTKPSLVYASISNYDKSSNQALGSGALITAGEILRLDLTAVPSGGLLDKFLIDVYGEV